MKTHAETTDYENIELFAYVQLLMKVKIKSLPCQKHMDYAYPLILFSSNPITVMKPIKLRIISSWLPKWTGLLSVSYMK